MPPQTGPTGGTPRPYGAERKRLDQKIPSYTTPWDVSKRVQRDCLWGAPAVGDRTILSQAE